MAKWSTNSANVLSLIQLASAKVTINNIRFTNVVGKSMMRIFLPVRKGDVVSLHFSNISYDSSMDTGEIFRFVYAEGSY